jgi:hypothetical protein
VFSGFKGFFKLEYWTKWQEILRNAVTLQKISFVKTKLERKHLVLLRALINWLKPNELSLKFKHNELDDEDLDDFLINELLKTWGRQIKQVCYFFTHSSLVSATQEYLRVISSRD